MKYCINLKKLKNHKILDIDIKDSNSSLILINVKVFNINKAN